MKINEQHNISKIEDVPQIQSTHEKNMKIEIRTNSDTSECDCCGTTWAQGGDVVIDGKLVLSKPASASCTGSGDWTESELLVMALKMLGHTIEVDGQEFHVTSHDEDYHGPLGD